uniref:C2H2-type domain-containing protein n=1 Tax=Haptolina brevifila TaxID=156173 RepID=A0A7S2G9M3_9EUKA
MSPMIDEPRQPLSPVSEPNLLAGADPLPVLDLGPELLKGENLGAPLQPERPRTLLHAQTSAADVPEPPILTDAALSKGTITPLQPVADPGLKVRVDAGTESPCPQSDDASWEQTSPPLTGEPGMWADDADSDDTRPGDGHAAAAGTVEDEAEDEDAVMVLLSLHRVPSQDQVSLPPPSVGMKRGRAQSPPDDDDSGPRLLEGDSRYFCRYPGCGKGYASTDAVRKHCRQRHLEWLRRLGHGCPQLYCRWGDKP